MTTIYVDNAATTKTSRTAIEAMLPYMDKIYGNPSSLYEFGQEAKVALEDARNRIAACIGADAKEIFFTSGGSWRTISLSVQWSRSFEVRTATPLPPDHGFDS